MYPKITTCIICEDVRPESSGKSTIVGFFGVAPEVEVTVVGIGEKVRISFMFTSNLAEKNQDYKFVFSIFTEGGKEVASSGSVDANLEKGKRAVFVFGFAALDLSDGGLFNFSLTELGGDTLFKSSFRVKIKKKD